MQSILLHPNSLSRTFRRRDCRDTHFPPRATHSESFLQIRADVVLMGLKVSPSFPFPCNREGVTGPPLQEISIRPFPGLVNFVPAVAYLFCLNLPAAFSQPGNGLIEIPCNSASATLFIPKAKFLRKATFVFCRAIKSGSALRVSKP